MGYRTFVFAVTCLLLAGGASLVILAADPDVEDERERAAEAAAMLQASVGAPDSDIPKELLKEAHAIAALPDVVKGALGVGGRHGKGLLSTRRADGSWSAPSYIELSGGSFGLQIGVSSTDLILVFANERGVKSLLEGKVKLGADASVAAGPVGRTAEASTDIKLNAEIYSYSRSKGLFAGLALDGAVLSIDDSANKKVYGANVSGTDLLVGRNVKSNATVQPFLTALERFVSERP